MNIKEVSKLENEALLEVSQEMEEFIKHAEFAIDMLSSFAQVKLPEGLIFSLFLNQVFKHSTLSLLSSLRRHHVQATLDLRFATEAGCWTAFAIANYEKESFAKFGTDKFIEPTDQLKKEMYKWIETNYRPGNDSLVRFKKQLNSLSTHANIVDAWRNFDEGAMAHDFFDKFKDHHIKTDIWAVANLCMGLLDLFYGINRDYNILTISPDFKTNYKELEFQNNKLKEIMVVHSGFVKQTI